MILYVSTGGVLKQDERGGNRIYLHDTAVLCKRGTEHGPISTCWSMHGCYVSQVYEHGTNKSKLITYGCIRNTEVSLVLIFHLHISKTHLFLSHLRSQEAAFAK